MSITRIKVRRVTLLSNLQEERAKLVAQSERDQDEYTSKLAAFSLKLDDEIETFVDLLATDRDKAMERVGSWSKGCYVAFPKVSVPTRHSPNMLQLDKMIRVLEISEDEHVSISADVQYARYM